jgi:phosphoribosylformimino-5-aminoimidazole carboxamide ribotide isomerase
MLLIPALDLRSGRCVRLLRGDFSRTTSYSDDPVATARGFADAGARWIHVVDLDAAQGKGSDNRSVIDAIRRAVPCRLEVGGGVRT